MRTPMAAAAAVILGLSLAACGSHTTNGAPANTTGSAQTGLPGDGARTTGLPNYTALLRELRDQYPQAGWTLDLVMQSSQSICNDLRTYTYEAVVRNRTATLGGDRAQAQETVIASVMHVCPDLKSHVPGMGPTSSATSPV